MARKVVDGSEEEGSEGGVGEQEYIGRAKRQQIWWVYSKPLIDIYCVYGPNLAQSCRAVATLDF